MQGNTLQIERVACIMIKLSEYVLWKQPHIYFLLFKRREVYNLTFQEWKKIMESVPGFDRNSEFTKNT